MSRKKLPGLKTGLGEFFQTRGNGVPIHTLQVLSKTEGMPTGGEKSLKIISKELTALTGGSSGRGQITRIRFPEGSKRLRRGSYFRGGSLITGSTRKGGRGEGEDLPWSCRKGEGQK